MDGEEPFLPNDAYEITDTSFRLYFRSQTEDAPNLEEVCCDSMGKEFPLSFTFNNEQVAAGKSRDGERD